MTSPIISCFSFILYYLSTFHYYFSSINITIVLMISNSLYTSLYMYIFACCLLSIFLATLHAFIKSIKDRDLSRFSSFVIYFSWNSIIYLRPFSFFMIIDNHMLFCFFLCLLIELIGCYLQFMKYIKFIRFSNDCDYYCGLYILL